MTAFTLMKTTLQEESFIPEFAVQAFHQASQQAKAQPVDVVYAENHKLLKKTSNGDVITIKDLSDAYITPKLKHSVLKRRKKAVSVA